MRNKKVILIFIFLLSVIIYGQTSSITDSLTLNLFRDYYKLKSGDEEKLLKLLTEASKKEELTNALEKLAFYDISFDFTPYMKKSRLINEYKDLRNTITDENYKKEKNDIFSLLAMILSRRFEEYKKAKANIADSKEKDYLDLLCALFSSDLENYQKLLSIYLLKYKDGYERVCLVRYQLMASYISDGEVFLQHYKKNWNKTRLLASIIARETPLMYEICLIENKEEDYDEIRRKTEKNIMFSAEIILIDYCFGKFDKDIIKNFVLRHTEFPLNRFLMELK